MKENLALRGYLAFSALYLICIFIGIEHIAWYLKPLLLPFLIYAVYKHEYFPTRKIMVVALLFSWFGDVVLMFSEKAELYFIVGLLLFLISHVFYIELFFKFWRDKNALKSIFFWLCSALVLYYLKTMLELLLPTLGELKIPVIVYAATISVMLIMAFKVFFSIKNSSRYLILLGAVSFVVSDSLLAINKFHEPLPYASLLIMATYLLAQFCITLGVLGSHQKK
jgi:uncharacterized membrane protein YhhN